jgi:hypothetical protein
MQRRSPRRAEPRVERRKAQVEINFLADTEARRAPRGCQLPFLGGGALLLLVVEAIRTVAG